MKSFLYLLMYKPSHVSISNHYGGAGFYMSKSVHGLSTSTRAQAQVWYILKTHPDLSFRTWILFLSLLQSCCVVLAEPQRVLLCRRYLNVQRSWAGTPVPGETSSALARIPPTTTHPHAAAALRASFWRALLELFSVSCWLALKGEGCDCHFSCLPFYL